MAGGSVTAVLQYKDETGKTVDVTEDTPLPTSGSGGGGGDASAANQVTGNTNIGATNETAAASDTATSGLNGLIKRLLARVTVLINALGGTDGLRAPTATRTTVNSGTTSVTILASNSARKGAVIYNSDVNILRLDMSGGSAAASRCQYAIATGQSFEVPFGFSGAITGIWDADGTGIADVVEFT